ncbi:hypothetical protein LOTGIDRAFT_232250 [Lottia gigantea]|uniref:BEN domain-containing protein n=1 Tax=Lottia gigantea TaxID=225164 RepID=V4C026_LOTGI|nr:hypothetical protein LOTGIDRAFT_232250 [Lottia gigantea]ESO94774.1 hypothetical protein LOTGIDRAFT_232250 [Lottia gigantea]
MVHGQARSDIRNLKEMCRRMKDQAKKEISSHQRETRKTGGGDPPKVLSPLAVLMKNLIPNEFIQRINPFDDDFDLACGSQRRVVSPVTQVSDDDNSNNATVKRVNEESVDTIYNIDDSDNVFDIDVESQIEDKNDRKETECPVEKRSSFGSDNSISASKTPKMDIEGTILKFSSEEHQLKMDIMNKEHRAKMDLFNLEKKVAESLLRKLTSSEYSTNTCDKRFKLQWSKGSQDFMVRKVKDPKDFTFREELMEATLSRLVQGTVPKDGAKPVPEQAMRSIGKKEKPNKLEAIQNHVTRFHRIC